jgi:hypothetical protein
VSEIGGDQGFGYILQAGEADQVGIGTQFGQRAFQCREAKQRFETFTDRRKNHYFLQIYSTVHRPLSTNPVGTTCRGRPH